MIKIVSAVEKIIGYSFNNKQLLIDALTHSSYANDYNCNSYEKLEFVGDSLVNLEVAIYLYNNITDEVGAISKYRTYFVSAEMLGKVIQQMGLINYIRVGKSIKTISNNICADVFESIVASIYFDSGQKQVSEFINKFLLKNTEHIDNVIHNIIDYKTALQEKIQSNNSQQKIIYEVIKKEKVDNINYFTVNLLLDDICVATARDTTIKKSEQQCSKIALSNLK